jgi:hypothetical protein
MTIDYPDLGELLVMGDVIVELSTDGAEHWRWRTFEHLDPQRTRTGFELPVVPSEAPEWVGWDWTHGNALVYDAADDSLLLSMRHQDWVIKIDHGSGEVIWRLGEGGDFELTEGRWFYHQHAPEWQPDGSLLLYDNGVDNPNLEPEAIRSRAVRYELDETNMTARQVWQDDEPPLTTPVAGDADRIDDDRLLVVDAAAEDDSTDPPIFRGHIRILDPNASPMKQWSLAGPRGAMIYRADLVSRLAGER